MIQVKVTGPLKRGDMDGFNIDVSAAEFKANPNKVFEVPNNKFWQKLIFDGVLIFVGMNYKKGKP